MYGGISEPGMGTYPPRVRRDREVPPSSNSRRARRVPSFVKTERVGRLCQEDWGSENAGMKVICPHSEYYVQSEQFDAMLVTTNTTVYEQRNSSPLLSSRITHSVNRQQKTEWRCVVTSQQVCMSHACQHISRKPARISRICLLYTSPSPRD